MKTCIGSRKLIDMASFIRRKIARYLNEAALKNPPALALSWENNIEKIPWCIRYRPVGKRSKIGPKLGVTYSHLRAVGALSRARRAEYIEWGQDVSQQMFTDEFLKDTQPGNDGLLFEIDSKILIKKCLNEISENSERYGYKSELHDYVLSSDYQVRPTPEHQNIVVEYSSPNIAKRFHAGHLRSTIIGNVLSNLFTNFGHKVTRINFLGNWGTQFGLIGVGYQRYGNKQQMESDPLQHLFEVYVKVNKEAANDENLKQEAREFFTRMEQGDKEALDLWQTCMDISIAEYKQMYKRLGVTFDRYDGEAMYVKKSQELIQDLKERNVLEINSDTGVGFVDVSSPDPEKRKKHANLVRSDGASLYLTRDIVAAIDRHENYNFDRLIYVVENSQHSHFEQLFMVLRRLGHVWAERPLGDFHVKFGRVEGMSTRRGEVVLLGDILDEARDRMLDIMRQKQSTKVSGEEMIRVADVLATSAIIVQDLKQRRLQNYTFSWERMLDFRGDTGVSLQYTHARLANIEVNCGVTLNRDCDLDLLTETSALNLVLHLARYDEVLQSTVSEMEPCQLIHYLFTLSRLVHVASEDLYVKGQPEHIAQARLLLFHSARSVLRSGLQTLGLQALDAL